MVIVGVKLTCLKADKTQLKPDIQARAENTNTI